MRPFHIRICLAISLILGLGACQSLPTGDTGPGPDVTRQETPGAAFLTPTEEEILQAFALESDQQWIDAALLYQELAEKSVQPERSSFFIKAGLMYYYAERYGQIEPYFYSLADDDILAQDQNYKSTILAGAFLGIGKIYQSLLALPDIDEIIDYRFKALALNIRSRGVLAIGKPLESANLRIQISQYLKTDDEINRNQEFIWEALNRITEPTIIRALSEQRNTELRGWLELNLIARRSNMLPAKIEPWITQWYQLYSGHTAGRYFAPNLLEESRRIYINPTRIALMLPFSGRLEKVSEAIQNGFLYAYFQNRNQVEKIEIINASENPTEFNLQYQQAIQNGADFIVGPINKDLINILLSQDNLEVPTLTLNYGDETKRPRLNLYQFGLLPEDEAEQIADYALAQGKHHALVLVPDTEWGGRLQRAFTDRFEKLGGRVVDTEIFPSKRNDYSAAIKKLLNLTGSEQRHSILQQVIGLPVKYDARRRQDVDMIFIAANARQARIIKPQLKFHHAQTIPVYATSHISSSSGNADSDRDLNDILFLDLPWMLDNTNNQDYQEIGRLWPEQSRSFSRLFALGVDAYRIIPSLRRLMINPEESIQRNTGKLSVDKQGRVRRELLMAVYEKGIARLLQTPQENN